MKRYLRLFLINLAGLWLTTRFLAGVSFSGGFQTLALATLALTFINLLVKPLLKVLLLPINLITLGAFRWLINVLSLYLVTIFVPQFKIEAFTLTGFNYNGFIIPTINLSVFWAFVATSLMISLTTTLLLWLVKK